MKRTSYLIRFPVILCTTFINTIISVLTRKATYRFSLFRSQKTTDSCKDETPIHEPVVHLIVLFSKTIRLSFYLSAMTVTIIIFHIDLADLLFAVDIVLVYIPRAASGVNFATDFFPIESCIDAECVLRT